MSNSKKTGRDHYLTKEQLEYFRVKLLNWKIELLKESEETINTLSREKSMESDSIDTACNVINQTIELRTKDRFRKLIKKIEDAIQRIDDDTYGYCEETGRPIGVDRLEARPIATLCIEAQEQHERKEKNYREDVVINE
jgi:DnaK suppressor protein